MHNFNKIGKTATCVLVGKDGHFTVRYHDTNVVTIAPDKSVLLYTGGYNTKTTLERMNQASDQFNLGYRVYQKDKKWYVDYQGETIKFEGERLVLRSAHPSYSDCLDCGSTGHNAGDRICPNRRTV